MMDFSLRRLIGEDAEQFRSLRLRALREHPEAFAASLGAETAAPADTFAARLQRNVVFGAIAPDGSLDGIVGYSVEASDKLKHKAVVWGMYVRPEARRGGVGSALMSHLIGDARDHVEELRLSVGVENVTAGRLYERLGFQEYGIEPRALKIGGRYLDERLMALDLAGSNGA